LVLSRSTSNSPEPGSSGEASASNSGTGAGADRRGGRLAAVFFVAVTFAVIKVLPEGEGEGVRVEDRTADQAVWSTMWTGLIELET
jgi:hypothetical protein